MKSHNRSLFVVMAICVFLFAEKAAAFDVTIKFTPFNLDDIVNPATGAPATAGERIVVSVNGKSLFDGTAEALLEILNLAEGYYNALGQSLRQRSGDLVTAFVTDPVFMRLQLLSDLGIKSEIVLARIKDAVTDCRHIALVDLGLNPGTSADYLPQDRISVGEGAVMRASDFVSRVNEQQELLCALGWSLFDGVDLGVDGRDVVQQLLAARGRAMNLLGISRFHRAFNLEPLKQIKKYADLAADVERIVAAKRLPGPERLAELRDKLPVVVPESLRIPELPNLPTVDLPRRMDLAIKKRKEWTGINRGRTDRFNVYATGFYEIRGNEHSQEATAEGKAGIYIFNRELRALQATGQALAGPKEVRAQVYLQALGYTLQRDYRDGVKVTVGDPRLLSYEFREAVTRQFSVGPIPVSVAAGADARLWAGWEAGLYTTQIAAKLGPGVDAEGYVDGAVGWAGLLCAGAGAELSLIALSAGLQGSVGLGFDRDAVPNMNAALTAGVSYSALVGSMYVFAEYPVPRFGIPPWRAKRATHEIFGWAGYFGDHRIMNWGMELSPFAARITGDLVDQTDRVEMALVQAAIERKAREEAVAQLERSIAEREAAAYREIRKDLGDESSLRVPREAALVDAEAAQFKQLREPYLREVARLTRRAREGG